MNNMQCKFQSEGRWEVVEIVAKMWPAILYRTASVEKSNSREKEGKICVYIGWLWGREKSIVIC